MRHNQNRRSRGRSRKGPNPLTRSYESNGPDVKVRGTAMHIAEKYMTLARDALSSGDNVAAENYLQHAEHYNRIVAAAQAQLQQSQPQQFRDAEDMDDDDRMLNGRGRDRFGFYTDADQDDGPDDRFDQGPGPDEGDRGPQRNAQRPEYREQRSDGSPDRFGGDRPRRDNREQRDNRDNREQRDFQRPDRFGDRQRQDYREQRGEGGFGGDRPRQDRAPRYGAPAESHSGEGRPVEEHEATAQLRPEVVPEPRAEAEHLEPQPVVETGIADEPAPKPRRRRTPKAAKNGAEDAGDAEKTRDGEAALAPFAD